MNDWRESKQMWLRVEMKMKNENREREDDAYEHLVFCNNRLRWQVY